MDFFKSANKTCATRDTLQGRIALRANRLMSWTPESATSYSILVSTKLPCLRETYAAADI
jgi:hypothetical protein